MDGGEKRRQLHRVGKLLLKSNSAEMPSISKSFLVIYFWFDPAVAYKLMDGWREFQIAVRGYCFISLQINR